MTANEQILPYECVLIAGGGPVGMLLATVLAYYGVKSLVLERNETTTKWPKMDLTNVRSMELLRKLGLADLIRQKGVPPHFPYPVLFSTGLNSEEALTKWILPSVKQYRETIQSNNNGTQPQEPYQRISQAVFEAALRERCDASELIELRFGWKVEGVEESEGTVRTTATEQSTGQTWIFTSSYVGACDGASSRVRRSLKLPLDGGPIPSHVALVHFKSRDLTRLHKQGQFWHLFTVFPHGGIGGACIAQNEVDTWTTHMFIPLETEASEMSSEDIVATVLGGISGKYPIKIDEILVRSTYRPHIAVARRYSSDFGRVYLAGDSAHQNIPTGGYGMNMGIGDAFDLGWKLAAVIKGYGGSGLLKAYEQERRPVALVSVEQSGKHMAVHAGIDSLLAGHLDIIHSNSEEAKELRRKIHHYYQHNGGENKYLGIEMGYRYESNIVDPTKEKNEPPTFDPSCYRPISYPGMRAPHVYLKDGWPIFDKCGPWYTLIEFADDENRGSTLVVEKATELVIPLRYVRLIEENHAHRIYDTRLVLLRPDFHVSWRGGCVESAEDAENILMVATGKGVIQTRADTAKELAGKPGAFTSTVGLNTQSDTFDFEGIGEMQM